MTAFNLWHMSGSGQYRSQANSLRLCSLWKEWAVHNARNLFMENLPEELSEAGVNDGGYRKKNRQKSLIFHPVNSPTWLL